MCIINKLRSTCTKLPGNTTCSYLTRFGQATMSLIAPDTRRKIMTMLDDKSIVDGPAMLRLVQDDPAVYDLLQMVQRAQAGLHPGTPGKLRTKSAETGAVLATKDVPPLGVSSTTNRPWPKASKTYIDDIMDALLYNSQFRGYYAKLIATTVIGLDGAATSYRLKQIQMHPQCPYLLYCRDYGFFWTPTFVQFMRAQPDREDLHPIDKKKIYDAFRLSRKFNPTLSTFRAFTKSFDASATPKKTISVPHPTIMHKLVDVVVHWVSYMGLDAMPWHNIMVDFDTRVWPTIPAKVKAEGVYSKLPVGSVEEYKDIFPN